MKKGLLELHKFSIRNVINVAMKENFEYEQRTVNQLFERYQRYKPIVSGVYGQDVVKEVPVPTEDGGAPPNEREKQVQDLIKRMQRNHGKVDLSVKYPSIPLIYD